MTPSGDSIYVLRETPAWKVRDRWKVIKPIRDEMTLHLSLNGYEDHLPLPTPDRKQGISRLMEIIAIEFCRMTHKAPFYNQGDVFCQCMCGRKYAVPWAVPHHPTIKPMFPAFKDRHMYVSDEQLVLPAEPIRQALCKHGTQGVC